MQLDLSRRELDLLYPAYIRTDRRGVIDACGASFERHLPQTLQGAMFLETFRVLRPAEAVSFRQLRAHDGVILIEHRAIPGLKLRGVRIARRNAVYFLLGHLPNVAEGGQAVKYRYTDFSPCDGSQDAFLAAQVRKGLLEDAHALAEQLRHEKVAAEAANTAKSNFIACMSHEIRTPLNGVLGMAEVLSKTPLSDNQAHMVKVIDSCGETLLQILNDILDLAKADAGRMEIVNEEFSIATLLKGLDTVYDLKCREKGIGFSIDADVAMTAPAYVGDVRRIRQVLNNLLSNAVKFTEAGAVTLSIDCVCDAAGQSRLVFRVDDTGIGIDAATRTRLFEPFVQADPSISRRFGGTGLGLSISRSLCDLMHGDIDVESAPGEGSTFRFSIPVGLARRRASAARA